MMGAREVVAKAVALECMRQARTQGRACFLYSFSGPGDCQEFELNLSSRGLTNLLRFLSGALDPPAACIEPTVGAAALSAGSGGRLLPRRH